MLSELTLSESQLLYTYETVIERGLQTFSEVGLALMEIRDERLYRAEFSTFEEYCRERWGFVDRHARRLIDAARAIENLSGTNVSLPANERQARVLASLPPDQQREVWGEVLRDNPPDTAITARAIEEAAARRKPDSGEAVMDAARQNAEAHKAGNSDGYIYFVQAQIHSPNSDMVYFNLVKIGFSRNPEQRFRRLQLLSPVILVLIGYREGTPQEEVELHQRFAMARSHGEWFRPDESIIDYIHMEANASFYPLMRKHP